MKKIVYIVFAIIALLIGIFCAILLSVYQKKDVGLLTINYKIFLGGDLEYLFISPKCHSSPQLVVYYNSEIAVIKKRFIVGRNPNRSYANNEMDYLPGYFLIDSITDKVLSRLNKKELENALENTLESKEEPFFLPAYQFVNLNGSQIKAMQEDCKSN